MAVLFSRSVYSGHVSFGSESLFPLRVRLPKILVVSGEETRRMSNGAFDLLCPDRLSCFQHTRIERPAHIAMASTSSKAAEDFLPSLRAHNASFLSLLSLIPPQFYLGAEQGDDEDDDEAAMNTRYMKNTKKANKAAEGAIEKKEKKRRKLDPEVVGQTVLDVQDQRRRKKEQAQSDDDEDGEDSDEDDETMKGLDLGDDGSDESGEQNAAEQSSGARPFGDVSASSNPQNTNDSILSLRQKLASKIASLQSRRSGPTGANSISLNGHMGGLEGADDDADSSSLSMDTAGDGASIASTRDELLEERRRKRGEMRDKRRRERKELRRQAAAGAAAQSSNKSGNSSKAGSNGRAGAAGQTSAPGLLVSEGKRSGSGGMGSSSASTSGDVNFSNLQFAGDDGNGKKKRDRNALPSNPKQALEMLQACKARKAAQQEKEGGNGEDDGASAEAWSKALSSARGIKIRDDEAMLQRSIKRKEKAKAKSGTEWKQRDKEVKEKQAKKQEKRTENLARRKELKKGGGKKGQKGGASSSSKKVGGAAGGGKKVKSRKPIGGGGGGGGGRAGFEGKKFGARTGGSKKSGGGKE